MAKLAAPFPRKGMSLGYGAYDGQTYTKSNPHRGQDWSSARLGSFGLPICASGPGVVRFNGKSSTSAPREGHPSSAHGNSIAVYYPSHGITVHYSHRRKADGPAVGQLTSLGTVLGNVGDTGLSTGEHLHMDVWRDGVRVDPALFFDFDVTVEAQPASGGVIPFDPADVEELMNIDEPFEVLHEGSVYVGRFMSGLVHALTTDTDVWSGGVQSPKYWNLRYPDGKDAGPLKEKPFPRFDTRGNPDAWASVKRFCGVQ